MNPPEYAVIKAQKALGASLACFLFALAGALGGAIPWP